MFNICCKPAQYKPAFLEKTDQKSRRRVADRGGVLGKIAFKCMIYRERNMKFPFTVIIVVCTCNSSFDRTQFYECQTDYV